MVHALFFASLKNRALKKIYWGERVLNLKKIFDFLNLKHARPKNPASGDF
jgi:hypothetical protein